MRGRMALPWLGAALLALPAGAAGQSAPRETGVRADLSVYAGGTHSTSWFAVPVGGEQQGHRIGYAPVFGAAATWWLEPRLGVRLHGAYVPSDLPDPPRVTRDNGRYPVNTYLADLDVVLRPWALRSDVRSWLSSTYVFVGAGGVVSSVAGDGVAVGGAFPCRDDPAYLAGGVCLPAEPDFGAVGALTVGSGTEVFPLTRRIRLFGEVAAHGYDSPAHVVQGGGGEDRYAVTWRVVSGVRVALGTGGEAPPPLPRIAPPLRLPPQEPAARPVVPPTDGVAPPGDRTVRVCLLRNGELTRVEARVDAATGDTTVDGRPFADAAQTGGGYAAGEPWFVRDEPVTVGGRRYLRFGLPRIVEPEGLRAVGTFRRVPVLVSAEDAAAEVVYLPLRGGCVVQPYAVRSRVLRVRG